MIIYQEIFYMKSHSRGNFHRSYFFHNHYQQEPTMNTNTALSLRSWVIGLAEDDSRYWQFCAKLPPFPQHHCSFPTWSDMRMFKKVLFSGAVKKP